MAHHPWCKIRGRRGKADSAGTGGTGGEGALRQDEEGCMSSVATTSRKKGRAGCRVAGQWLGRCSMGVFYPRGHDGSRKAQATPCCQVPGNPDRLCGEALWHGLTLALLPCSLGTVGCCGGLGLPAVSEPRLQGNRMWGPGSGRGVNMAGGGDCSKGLSALKPCDPSFRMPNFLSWNLRI